MIGGAMVMMPNGLAFNGILHRIDTVILGEEQAGTPAPMALIPTVIGALSVAGPRIIAPSVMRAPRHQCATGTSNSTG